MLALGVQTQNAVRDGHEAEDFAMIRRAGFTSVDFSLHGYLKNKEIYGQNINHFFDRSDRELEEFFDPHKKAAEQAGIVIGQMHMPYPIYVPTGSRKINAYLWREVAPKSMKLCHFLGCHHIVVHGMKLARFLGSEEAEWEETERFLRYLAPMAKEMGITICIENLYDSVEGPGGRTMHIVEGPCCNARKSAERIDRLNEDYSAEVLGYCFDTGHANLIGIDPEEFIGILGHRLKVLHIHDNDGMRDLHQIPFTFTRTRENRAATDWDGFLRGLRRIDYRGILNFETGPVLRAFPQAMKEDVLSFIAKIGRWLSGELE